MAIRTKTIAIYVILYGICVGVINGNDHLDLKKEKNSTLNANEEQLKSSSVINKSSNVTNIITHDVNTTVTTESTIKSTLNVTTNATTSINIENNPLIEGTVKNEQKIHRRTGVDFPDSMIKKPSVTLPSGQIVKIDEQNTNAVVKPIEVINNPSTTESSNNTTKSTTNSTIITSTPKTSTNVTTIKSSSEPVKVEQNVRNSTQKNGTSKENISTSTHFSAEEPQIGYSQEYIDDNSRSFSNSYLPLTLTIFLVPIVIIGIMMGFRRFKSFWYTRHYRRMDFLIDEMYND